MVVGGAPGARLRGRGLVLEVALGVFEEEVGDVAVGALDGAREDAAHRHRRAVELVDRAVEERHAVARDVHALLHRLAHVVEEADHGGEPDAVADLVPPPLRAHAHRHRGLDLEADIDHAHEAVAVQGAALLVHGDLKLPELERVARRHVKQQLAVDEVEARELLPHLRRVRLVLLHVVLDLVRDDEACGAEEHLEHVAAALVPFGEAQQQPDALPGLHLEDVAYRVPHDIVRDDGREVDDGELDDVPPLIGVLSLRLLEQEREKPALASRKAREHRRVLNFAHHHASKFL
mmetsp:Transcript_11288/g.18272  ORF Transcript_11288/g.18272 Transcript_11288/m.18272 type:complete len:291 (+) Transcript_11288:1070-1942(+)